MTGLPDLSLWAAHMARLGLAPSPDIINLGATVGHVYIAYHPDLTEEERDAFLTGMAQLLSAAYTFPNPKED